MLGSLIIDLLSILSVGNSSGTDRLVSGMASRTCKEVSLLSTMVDRINLLVSKSDAAIFRS